MSACRVIWPPHVPLTALSLIAAGAGRAALAQRLEPVEQGLLERDRLARVERLGTDQHRRPGALPDGLHRRGLLAHGLLVDRPHLLDRRRRPGTRGRELELRAAGEVDAEVEPAEDDRADADEDERAEDRVPELPPARRRRTRPCPCRGG